MPEKLYEFSCGLISIFAFSCQLDDETNYNDCLETYIEEHLGCRLPWRKTNNGSASMCQYPEELEKFRNLSMLIKSLGESQKAMLTNCHKSCSMMSYFSR